MVKGEKWSAVAERPNVGQSAARRDVRLRALVDSYVSDACLSHRVSGLFNQAVGRRPAGAGRLSGGSSLGCHAPGDLGRADALQRHAVADAFFHQPPQSLGQRNTGVPAGERRLRGDAVGDLVRAGEQAIGRHDFIDHAPVLRRLRVEHLAGEQELAAAD